VLKIGSVRAPGGHPRRALALARLALLALAGGGCAAGAGPPPSGASAVAATARLGQRTRLGDVVVTPLRIEEDSRCPTGVQCIQAGIVRVAVRIAEAGTRREAVAAIGRSLGLAAGRLTLCGVTPYPSHPGRIRPDSYRFRFALDHGAAAPAATACADASGG
jgi:hypothetical protein